MTRSKIIIGLVLVLLLALPIAGCGQSSSTAAGTEKSTAVDTTAAPQNAAAVQYPAPTPLKEGSQASFDKLAYKAGSKVRVVYMPPATEFNYYQAIGMGIKDVAQKNGADYSLLAPQSGNDINGQMGMIQDVITQKNADIIIFNSHDEHAAAPLIKQAVEEGIEVFDVNSDMPNFPTPIHAVVGYSQRKGDHAVGDYVTKLLGDKPTNVGILLGAAGYFSDERVGGFLDALNGKPNYKVVSKLDGNWNVEGGNTAAMNMMQAHPEINVIFAANDYEIMGAEKALSSLNKTGVLLLGSDGDTACLEEIAAGNINATLNTTPFVMGQMAMQAALDGLNGKFKGGWVETPGVVVDKSNVMDYLKHPETLYPKPSKQY